VLSDVQEKLKNSPLKLILEKRSAYLDSKSTLTGENKKEHTLIKQAIALLNPSSTLTHTRR
jgi:hypothetical protein